MSASTGRDEERAHPTPIVRPNANRTTRPAQSSAWRESVRWIQSAGRFEAKRTVSLYSRTRLGKWRSVLPRVGHPVLRPARVVVSARSARLVPSEEDYDASGS